MISSIAFFVDWLCWTEPHPWLLPSNFAESDILEKLVTIQTGSVSEKLPASESIILVDEPNEVRIELLGGKNISINVNEVEFRFQIGAADAVKAFRHVSFSTAADAEVQEFFFNCDPLPEQPEPEQAQNGHASQPEKEVIRVDAVINSQPIPNIAELE